jgi:hypothetical protein
VLQAAAESGHLKIINRLLAVNADVNAAPFVVVGRGYKQNGHLEVVERLLAANADVNTPARYGRTALQAASQNGHLEVVERWLVTNANVNTPAC